MHDKRRRRPNPRRANLTVELLLLLPILLACAIAAAEVALLATVKNKVEAASAIGARVAAQGGDDQAIEKAVKAFLGAGALEEAEVKAKLLDASGLPLPPGEPVEVVVTVAAHKAVPDLLGFIGLSIKNKPISGRTLMRKE